MKKLKMYEYKNCSTCKKALKFLINRNINFDAIDITQQPPSRKELEKMLVAYKGNIKKLFNTSGQSYREKKIAEKIDTMNEGDLLKLLEKDGKLIKRPFLIGDTTCLVGFKLDEWSDIL
ncbi:MAG: Spx/MgsR family RNA polymerase-binding regulatory protein [Oligoflexia bacterium]|nr:Spx/MgsR family RNA polymerase-binding regulatory protein [Oligoflexia bacterium]